MNVRGTVFHQQPAASLDGFGYSDGDAAGSFENRCLRIAFADVLARKFYIGCGGPVDLAEYHALDPSQANLSGSATGSSPGR